MQDAKAQGGAFWLRAEEPTSPRRLGRGKLEFCFSLQSSALPSPPNTLPIIPASSFLLRAHDRFCFSAIFQRDCTLLTTEVAQSHPILICASCMKERASVRAFAIRGASLHVHKQQSDAPGPTGQLQCQCFPPFCSGWNQLRTSIAARFIDYPKHVLLRDTSLEDWASGSCVAECESGAQAVEDTHPTVQH